MHITQRKQEYSYAYIQALAAVAGFSHSKPSVDDDSIDFTVFASSGYIPRAPKLDVQLKCTEKGKFDGTGQNFVYDLKIKNYNDLRTECSVPRVLVVVLVPEKLEDWISHSEECLTLSRCAYWYSLAGLPNVENSKTARILVPRTQILSAQSLTEMMHKSSRGESL